MANIDEIRKEFYLKEYEFLKAEIAELVEHSRKLEIYAVTAMAAFYAWYINGHFAVLALLLPVIMAVLGGFRSYVALIRINEIGTYLRAVESGFDLGEVGPGGSETWRKKVQARITRSSIHAAPFASSAAVFWIVLVGLSCYLLYDSALLKALQITPPGSPVTGLETFLKPSACHEHCCGTTSTPPALW